MVDCRCHSDESATSMLSKFEQEKARVALLMQRLGLVPARAAPSRAAAAPARRGPLVFGTGRTRRVPMIP